MKHLDLCSGIGGFALAASWVWPRHEVAAFVEIDQYCQQVLHKHWPGALIHDDLKTFDARPFRGSIDLLTGGYPCQPFSHAGKRKGEADDRNLWPEVLRVTLECRPRWALFENVAGHVTLGLDQVLADLERGGYSCEAAIIPACAVDAPHRRDRVWIIAHDDRAGRERPELPLSARRQDQAGSEPLGYGQAMADTEVITEWAGLREGESGGVGRGRSGYGCGADATANSHGAGQQKRHATAVAARTRFDPRPSPKGWAQWSAESGVRRISDGVSRRVDRLRALGNAIVPAVAAEIMMAMKSAEAA